MQTQNITQWIHLDLGSWGKKFSVLQFWLKVYKDPGSFLTFWVLSDIRDYKIWRQKWQRECQKSNRFNKQTNNLLVHQTFLYIPLEFCAWLQRENVLHNFMFYGGCKKAPTKFYFSVWTWITRLGIQLQESLPTFKKVCQLEKSQ